VFNHNIETVASQQKRVRPQAKYPRSLETLRLAKRLAPQVRTKSGIMVGLGETRAELLETLADLRAVACDLLTIGQYLKPSRGAGHVPVERFYPPEEFDELAAAARELGFAAVASGPFVRSSYFAESLYRAAPADGTAAAGGDQPAAV
jgi:lipoic acid synthetase